MPPWETRRLGRVSAEEILIVIHRLKLLAGLGSAAQRIAVFELLNVPQPGGDAAIAVGVIAVEGDGDPAVAAGVHLGLVKNPVITPALVVALGPGGQSVMCVKDTGIDPFT